MALPFILGLAIGAGAVVAFNKSKKLKEFTSSTLEQGKDMANDVKDVVIATKECIKEKKEQIKESTEECCQENKEVDIKENKECKTV